VKQLISLIPPCVAAICVSSIALAFETQTHAFIASRAYDLSVLANGNSKALLARFGLDRLSTSSPFVPYWDVDANIGYYDNTPGTSDPLDAFRFENDYERRQMQQLAYSINLWIPDSTVENSGGSHVFPIRNWILRGAIREDDLTADYYADEIPPDPDPWMPIERSFNHFYDPRNNAMLHSSVPFVDVPPEMSCSNPVWAVIGSGGFCYKSIDWALGTTDAFTSLVPDPNRHNHFSWEDARQNEFLALTAKRPSVSDSTRMAVQRKTESEERLARWATTFRSLGDVLHLLQDTGQPQHTRNDKHDSHSGPAEREAFEPFTNARLIGIADATSGSDPSDGQTYVRSLNASLVQTFVLPPFPDISTFPPPPSFATPLRFFTTRLPTDSASTLPDNRYGLADYSNRGFFTRGTMPITHAFDEPPIFVDDGVNGYTKVSIPCAELPTFDGTATRCVIYNHVVKDSVNPGRSDAILPQPTIADGVFSNLPQTSYQPYTLGPEIFQVQGNLIIPRAAAYSAGLINYFFRGELTLSSPPDGLYAVADQGAPHGVDADGYPRSSDGSIFGFTTLRVRVKNTTPDVVESGAGTIAPQTMQGGKLVAVARYHRNPCYKPDLSGEYVKLPSGSAIVPSGCSPAQMRTAYQEISVSAPLSIDVHGDFPGTNNGSNACANVGNIATGAAGACADAGGVLGEFDFSADPIPINATDLFVQVVYRGPLGDEPDGIAVGSKDILEPTFFTVWNNTDWYLYDGAWTLPQNVPYPPIAPVDAAGVPLTAALICFNDQLIEGLATGQQLAPARFFRTAVLADVGQVRFGAIMLADDGISYGSDGPMPTVERQAETEQGSDYTPDPIPYYARGTPAGVAFQQRFKHYGAFTFAQYIQSLMLAPALGDPQSPGIPLPVGVQFTSAPQDDCSYYLSRPGATPGDAQGGGRIAP